MFCMCDITIYSFMYRCIYDSYMYKWIYLYIVSASIAVLSVNTLVLL